MFVCRHQILLELSLLYGSFNTASTLYLPSLLLQYEILEKLQYEILEKLVTFILILGQSLITPTLAKYTKEMNSGSGIVTRYFWHICLIVKKVNLKRKNPLLFTQIYLDEIHLHKIQKQGILQF